MSIWNYEWVSFICLQCSQDASKRKNKENPWPSTQEIQAHWRILLEEYGPEIVYIKDKANVVADALSRHPKQGDIVEDIEVELPFVPVDTTTFPTQWIEVQELQ